MELFEQITGNSVHESWCFGQVHTAAQFMTAVLTFHCTVLAIHAAQKILADINQYHNPENLGLAD